MGSQLPNAAAAYLILTTRAYLSTLPLPAFLWEFTISAGAVELNAKVSLPSHEKNEMQKHGPWTIRSSRQVYCDPWIELQLDQVTRPDGQAGTYSTVKLKSGVCVIAVDEQQRIHLTKEFHYAVGRLTIEGVSGGIEGEESSLLAAQRELAEELGWKAQSWQHLGTVDPFTAAIHSTVDLYLARELTACAKSPEGTEQIVPVVLPIDEALQMVRSSEISHAPTCVALLRIALDGLLA